MRRLWEGVRGHVSKGINKQGGGEGRERIILFLNGFHGHGGLMILVCWVSYAAGRQADGVAFLLAFWRQQRDNTHTKENERKAFLPPKIAATPDEIHVAHWHSHQSNPIYGHRPLCTVGGGGVENAHQETAKFVYLNHLLLGGGSSSLLLSSGDDSSGLLLLLEHLHGLLVVLLGELLVTEELGIHLQGLN
jgi:hypothetical protein